MKSFKLANTKANRIEEPYEKAITKPVSHLAMKFIFDKSLGQRSAKWAYINAIHTGKFSF